MFLKYLYSTDHKVIGLLYGFTSLFFLLVGFVLVIIIRWQLVYPGEPVPHLGARLGEAAAASFVTPTQTGEWEIACSQLCGLGHYRMRGFYTIHTQADYEAWLAEEAALLATP